MSSQSGISISSDLDRLFQEFEASKDRALVLQIVNEAGELEHRIAGTNDLSQDLESAIAGRVNPDQARYLVIRDNDNLAFVSYVPDNEKVRNKMLYASSTQNIFKQLGGSSTFSSSFFWTEHKEISRQGWDENHEHIAADAPLTEEEQSLKTAIAHEANRMGSGKSSGGFATAGIEAKIAPDAIDKLKHQLANNSESSTGAELLVLGVDSNETIQVIASNKVGTHQADQMSNHFAGSTPKFGVLTNSGKAAFFYVVPDDSSIKQRMLCASTRVSFLNYVKSLHAIDEVIETSEPDDLSSSSVLAGSAPTTDNTPVVSRPRFSRPKRPGR